MRFCRWLTDRAGIAEEDQAYPDADSLDAAECPRDTAVDAQAAPIGWPVLLSAKGFRLPTEAEWEIACRAGTTSPYSFGGDANLLHRYGWFGESSQETVRTGRLLRPDLRGLFDMHGNSAEWCHDGYSKYPRGIVVTDPIGDSKTVFRVCRGGALESPASICRSASRSLYRAANIPAFTGLRVVLSLQAD